MIPRVDRRLVGMTARAIGVLALLLVPWPGLGHAVGAAFSGAANLCLGGARLHSVVSLDFRPATPTLAGGAVANPAWFVVLTLQNTMTGAATQSLLYVRPLVYVPFAVFVALTLAAPLRPARVALVAFVTGSGLVCAFVVVAVSAPLLLLFAEPRLQLVTLGPWSYGFLKTVFNATAETSFIVPFLAWLFARWVGSSAQQGMPRVGRALSERLSAVMSRLGRDAPRRS